MAEEPEGDQTETEAVAEPVVETRFGVPVTTSRGQTVLHPGRDELIDLVSTLRDEGFSVCVDACAVDYLDHARTDLPATVTPERFEMVYTLLSHSQGERIRLRVQVPADEPEVPTLFDVHPGTEAMEREANDLFGIVFTDHPDPTRILMPEDWRGHPLRKDHEVGSIPVQFKAPASTR